MRDYVFKHSGRPMATPRPRNSQQIGRTPRRYKPTGVSAEREAARLEAFEEFVRGVRR